MKKIIPYLTAILFIIGAHLATAAPTSTLVQNLKITSFSSSTTLCVKSVNGLLATAAADCGSGGSSTSTVTINGSQSSPFSLIGSGAVTSTVSGATTTFSIVTSTLYSFFSATSPIQYNNTTGVFSWTNSNNYISSSTGNSLYLQILNNLSDLNSSDTARGNLGLASSSNPIFAGLTVSGVSSSTQLRSPSSTLGVIHATQIYDSSATSTQCETADPVTGLISAGTCVVSLNNLTGNVIATGTANQIQFSSSSGNLVGSIPSALILPGTLSVTQTSTFTANVGIGTSTPARLLHVYGDQSAGVALFERTNAATNSAVGTTIIQYDSTGNLTDGGGAAYIFRLQDASGTNSQAAAIDALSDGGGTGSTRLEFWTSLTSSTRSKGEVIDHNGNVLFPGNATVSGNSILQGTTFTSATGTGNLQAKTINEPFATSSATASSTSINWALSNKQWVQLNVATTSFSFSNCVDGGSYTLWPFQNATGSETVSWPSSGSCFVSWASSTAPTLPTTANYGMAISFQAFAPPGTTTIVMHGQFNSGAYTQ